MVKKIGVDGILKKEIIPKETYSFIEVKERPYLFIVNQIIIARNRWVNQRNYLAKKITEIRKSYDENRVYDVLKNTVQGRVFAEMNNLEIDSTKNSTNYVYVLEDGLDEIIKLIKGEYVRKDLVKDKEIISTPRIEKIKEYIEIKIEEEEDEEVKNILKKMLKNIKRGGRISSVGRTIQGFAINPNITKEFKNIIRKASIICKDYLTEREKEKYIDKMV